MRCYRNDFTLLPCNNSISKLGLIKNENICWYAQAVVAVNQI